jgi:putative CocE/NonD family hydrolase
LQYLETRLKREISRHPRIPLLSRGRANRPIKPTAISTAQWRHPGQERTNASLESGDPLFFARRGYARIICNARGTGKSEGKWQFLGPQEVQDVCEVIEWMAGQPWCDGNVVMFGVSYFSQIQLLVAQFNPPQLEPPWAITSSPLA